MFADEIAAPAYNRRMKTSDTASRLVSTGRRFDDPVATANLPVYRASTVLFDTLAEAAQAGRDSMAGVHHATSYGTSGTPTTLALADALAEIEGAGHATRAALMPSGLSAITTLLLAFLEPGDHLLVPDSVYGPTRAFCDGLLTSLGISVEYYAPGVSADELAPRFNARTRMLYLESPGSYTFELQDIPALCALARGKGVITAIDNAWASPVFSRPFEWGVDASVLPLTKYWSGHSDVLMGAAVVREELWPRLWRAIRQLGVCVGSDDAFLILRGLRTAQVRMERHYQSALAVARWLESRPEVARVLFPALQSHPQHALWQRDFTGASGLFAVELKPEATGGLGWGGVESLIMPARLSGVRSVQPWAGGPLIRIHVGLDDPTDLIADLADGFAAMRQAASAR